MSGRWDRRTLLEALRDLPSKHRAWLGSDDIELYAYYGWGIVLNDAQLEEIYALRDWPGGTFHVWRWANRTGKTTGLWLAETWFVWKKWGYRNEDADKHFEYPYQVLHAAPLNELAGKAIALSEQILAGIAPQQQNPFTYRQRPSILGPFFTSLIERDKAGVDRPALRCANNGKVDFRSTQGGAGRLESDQWHLFVWDEFPRQAPIDDIELIIDQTVLPRTSDFMAPVVLSGTATEDTDWVYSDLEEIARSNPRDWHFTSHERASNFSQSRASIERQTRMAINKETVERSVFGRSGVSRGHLFPDFVLDNAFRRELPDEEEAITDEAGLASIAYLQAFDHALAGDDNVLLTAKVPWPTVDVSPENPVVAVARKMFPSRRTLTPAEQQDYLARENRRYHPIAVVIDSTAEGGLGVYRTARASGLPAVDCSFNARAVKFTTNKEYGLQALQQLLCWGLDLPEGELVEDWTEPDPGQSFGILRFPGSWTRLRRQLAILRRQDQKLRQDEAMTALMLAWYIFKLIPRPGVSAAPQPFNIMARRRRGRF